MATRMKFKRGDQARCIGGNYAGPVVNEIYTVKQVENSNEGEVIALEQVAHRSQISTAAVYNAVHFELVSQTGKLLGYKSLKYIPLMPAGSMLIQRELAKSDKDFYYGKEGARNEFHYSQEEMQLYPDWFEPVYEPENTILETVNGKQLEISKKNKTVVLVDGRLDEKMTFAQAKLAANYFLKSRMTPTAHGNYSVIILDLRIKIGCIELNLADLEKVVAAIEK